MARFRSKVVEIEATQFNIEDKSTHVNVNFSSPDPAFHLHEKYWISTLEGPFVVSHGDWIVTGLKGEKYPVKPDIMALKYERIGD